MIIGIVCHIDGRKGNGAEIQADGTSPMAAAIGEGTVGDVASALVAAESS